MNSLLFAVGKDPINLDVVKGLLKRGADVNLGNAENVTPLLYLLTRRHGVNITAMTMLLENGADVNVRAYCCNCAALHHALRRPDCDENTIHLLLQHGAEVNALDNAQYTPLHYAVIKFVKESSSYETRYDARRPFVRKVIWADLLFRHFEPNDKDCNESLVEELLLRGASVDAVNDFDETALHLAVRNPKCSANVIRLLMRNEANVNAQCHLNHTPLLYAVQVNWDNESVIAELLEGGADPNIRCSRGISALHHAVRNPFCTLHVTKALLSRGAEVNQPDLVLCTPLQYAVDNVHELKVDHIEELLKNGALPNASDMFGCNALKYALWDYRCTVKLARMLLRFRIEEDDLEYVFRAVTDTRFPLDLREELMNHGIDASYRYHSFSVLDDVFMDVCSYQSSQADGIKGLHDRTDWARLLLQKGYYVTDSCIWKRVTKKLLQDNIYFKEGEKAFEFLKFITKYALLEIPDADVVLSVEFVVTPNFAGDDFLSFSYSPRLMQFQEYCGTEIRTMDKTPLSRWGSLLAFLRSYEVCREKQTAEELVRTLSACQLPVYSEVIAYRMDRATLIEIMTQQKVPLTAAPGDPSPLLAPNSLFGIANYLPNEDILNCILAFCHKQS